MVRKHKLILLFIVLRGLHVQQLYVFQFQTFWPIGPDDTDWHHDIHASVRNLASTAIDTANAAATTNTATTTNDYLLHHALLLHVFMYYY